MKVVIAHNRYTSALPSGENVIVDTEIAQLSGAGVTVLPFLRNSDDIGTLPTGQKALLPIAPIWAPAAQRSLAELLVRERPDVLHLHNPYPLLSPWVIRTAHAHGVPVVQTVHNYRQVCAPGLYFRDGHICTDCRGKAFALPAIRHACYRGSRAQSAIMATTLAVHRSTWRSLDQYVALTEAMADHLRDYGIRDDQITVKPNGIADPGPFAGGGSGFLFLGRLSAEKGLPLLLAAWGEHPVGALGPLRIAGDGPDRGRAEAFAATRPDVEYLGPVAGEAKFDAIRAAAAMIVPSTWHEPLPTVVLEALACGRPVLASALGGLPYLVGDAGWTVPATVDALSAALPIASSSAESLAKAARERYLSNFTPEINTARLIGLYESLSGRRPTG